MKELRQLEKALREFAELEKQRKARIAAELDKLGEVAAEWTRKLWKLESDIREAVLTKRESMQSRYTPVIRAPIPLQDTTKC